MREIFKKYKFIFCVYMILISLVISSSKPLSAQSDTEALKTRYYFYNGLDYGSETLINPIRLILNGGLGILQVDSRSNRLSDIDFKNGADNLWMNLSDPFGAIGREGAGKFFLNELFPVSLKSNDAHYWPNYTLHLIGGGMSYRMMAEWFEMHNYGHPRTYSILTISLYHLLNEVVENNKFVGYSADPIADLYIFDPLGILLFNSDRVSRFFSETLNMADWSYQVCYNPEKGSVQNIGQNFVLKYWINDDESKGIFYHMGTHGELGLSFRRPGGDCISFGAGLVPKKLIDISNSTNFRSLTADLVVTAGVFYDRHNSLLASLIYSKSQDYMLRLNLYPGLFKIKNVSPGIFMSLSQDNDLSFGINFKLFPFGISNTF
ncbi:MAG: hypothetical protein U5O15_04660 [Candidatus Krumholzibacteriota bacterium]|nr:hypothetical protein [Candidatus Krumholzibacteriota bacterium]